MSGPSFSNKEKKIILNPLLKKNQKGHFVHPQKGCFWFLSWVRETPSFKKFVQGTFCIFFFYFRLSFSSISHLFYLLV